MGLAGGLPGSPLFALAVVLRIPPALNGHRRSGLSIGPAGTATTFLWWRNVIGADTHSSPPWCYAAGEWSGGVGAHDRKYRRVPDKHQRVSCDSLDLFAS